MAAMKIFVDFDGTITKNDVIDLILETFASSDWRDVEKEWINGKIGSRECLTRQMSYVKATPEKLANLLARVEIDPHFEDFLLKARELSAPVFIVSDGFKTVINTVLKKRLRNAGELMTLLPIFSNDIEWSGKHWHVTNHERSECKHGCGTCKEKIITKLRKKNEKIIFVGDGLSDRYAAKTADLTFAKNRLLLFCEEQGLIHNSYMNFEDVTEWLVETSG